MKKSFYLMVILAVVAIISLPVAFVNINNEKESIVITEEVLAGDPEAAEGVTLQFLTQWEALALWDTKYTIGSGETVTAFEFFEDGVTWPREGSEYLDFNIPVNFGTATAVGAGAGGDPAVDLEDMWLPDILKDVAGRTNPGETHTEIVQFADYYQYYPIELGVFSEDKDVTFYSNGIDYFSDYFRVNVHEEEKLTVSITKNEEGTIVAVDCNSIGDGDGVSLVTAYAFGENGCFFTYACTDWETGDRIKAEENTGIFYLHYMTENRRLTFDPDQIEKVCEIPEDIVPAQMLLDEERQELYLAAKAGNEYRLYIYDVIGEEPVLKKELLVLSEEAAGKEAYWREMTLEEGGILMKWSDGSFSFVAENVGTEDAGSEDAGDYQLWCSDVFAQSVINIEGIQEIIEIGYKGEVFGYEHACAFDGERLVLACYDSWDSVNVTLAVYDREKQLYCGRYHHSAESDIYMSGLDRSIYPQGVTVGSHLRGQAKFEPLRLIAE